MDDPTRLRRRPLAVKVSNAARVRPQHGLNSADLVFEHVSEGGITRFTAVFYSQDSAKVGSIRSARLIDLEIPLMYDAAFAYSGSSAPIKSMIRAGTFFERVISPDFEHNGFYRESKPGLRFEDTMFTDTFVLRSILQQRGEDVSPELTGTMAFAAEPPPGGQAGPFVEVQYGATIAYWHYDAGSGRYLRWSDGARHLDAASEEQLSFKNILIVRAQHQPTAIIEDSLGSPSIQIQFWGQGPLQLHRDGLWYEGYWRREATGHMLTFYDESSNPLPLAPGNSFIHLVPLE